MKLYLFPSLLSYFTKNRKMKLSLRKKNVSFATILKAKYLTTLKKHRNSNNCILKIIKHIFLKHDVIVKNLITCEFKANVKFGFATTDHSNRYFFNIVMVK